MKHKFERYCKEYENIENYEAAKKDNFIGWCCHHRKGVNIAAEELRSLGMYYNRPADELIFLTESEHDILHKKGKPKSEEHKKKLSEAKKGKHLSEEHKKKMSEAQKGYHWYNNGEINIRAKECPPGFVPGMLKRK